MTVPALRGVATQQDGPVTESRGSQGDSHGFREWIDYAQSLGHITGEIDFYEWVLMHELGEQRARLDELVRRET